MGGEGPDVFRGRLPLAFGLAFLISLAGCDRKRSVSGPHKDGAVDVTENRLRPEEARSALVRMAEGKYAGLPRTGDGPFILRRLDSPEELDALKRAPVRGGNTDVWISDWYCRLGKRTFERTFELVGGHKYVINGTFQMKPQRHWQANIDGVAHLNTGPRPKP